MTEHYKYVIHGKLENSQMDIVNVYYVRFDNPFMPTATQASAYVNNLMGPVLNDLTQDYSVNFLGISHWEGPADGIWYDFGIDKPKKNPPWSVETPLETTAIQGGATDEMLPPQVSAVVYAKTPTKHVIARKFIGPYTEAGQGNGLLTATALTHLEQYAEKWKLWVEGAGGPPAPSEVWGYKRGFNTIINVHADQVLGTNRRRKIGRGS